MTPEEITKLAEEYAVEVTKDMAKTLDEPSCLLNETKRATKEYITDFICWLLRSHCIVEKSKVREEYQRAKDMNQDGIDLKTPVLCTFGSSKKVLLESLFDPDTFDETDK